MSQRSCTPLSILREQAAALTQQTHGVLVGEATANPEGERIVVSLDIIAPGLNDYRYRVMRYEQPPEMYPGTLRMGGDGDIISDEFLTSWRLSRKSSLPKR